MKKVALLLTVLISLSIVSCKKKEVEAQKSNKELLTSNSSKTWKISKGTLKQGSLSVDLTTIQSPCITDNTITLFSDLTYEFKEGASKCAASDPDLILKANWAISSDEKEISVSKLIFLGRTVDNPTIKLTTVTETEFSGTTQITNNGTVYDAEITFSAVK